jgi:hypothetical protein
VPNSNTEPVPLSYKIAVFLRQNLSMYSKTLPLTLFALLTAALSCKKTQFAPAPVSTSCTVYVSGYSGPTGSAIGTYWTNGVATTIPNTGVIKGITVSGSDVYLLGDSVYWKNGVSVTVPGAVGLSSIFVSGGDVYLTGYTAATSTSATAAAVYWKNGAMTNLTQNVDHVTAASANSIYLSNTDVYVAGSFAINHQPAAGVYWKNGVANVVTGARNLTAVVATSSHVIALGETDSSGTAFWTDNTGGTWSGPNAGFISLYISPQSDYYITGYTTHPTEAAYWSNAGFDNWIENTITFLPQGDLTSGVFISGSDVYLSGTNSSGQAIYWKNGVADTLGKGVPRALRWHNSQGRNTLHEAPANRGLGSALR